jgi:hypothetical protein
VALLLAVGANANLKDCKSMTALDIVKKGVNGM